jgi:hypothetical protein
VTPRHSRASRVPGFSEIGGAGRWTWRPGETLSARPAMCGGLGRASVNSGAANQRSPNDVDPFEAERSRYETEGSDKMPDNGNNSASPTLTPPLSQPSSPGIPPWLKPLLGHVGRISTQKLIQHSNISWLCGWGTWIRTKIDGVRVCCSTVELSPTAPATRRLRGAPCGFDARLSKRAAVVKAAPGSVLAPALLRFVALTIRTPRFGGRLGQGRRVARRK